MVRQGIFSARLVSIDGGFYVPLMLPVQIQLSSFAKQACRSDRHQWKKCAG
jgi:hypothetical protein